MEKVSRLTGAQEPLELFSLQRNSFIGLKKVILLSLAAAMPAPPLPTLGGGGENSRPGSTKRG